MKRFTVIFLVVVFFSLAATTSVDYITQLKNRPDVLKSGNNVVLGTVGLGNVGIGTASPFDALAVRPPVGSGYAGLSIRHNGNTSDETTLTMLHATSGYGWRQRVRDLDGSFVLDVQSASAWTNNALYVKSSNGNVGIGTSTPAISGTGKFHVSGNTVRPIDTLRTPASSIDTCNIGEITFDALYVYTCVATNTWRRAATATW